MQFKVPQNVQMEDKIVGPLTLKQLMICAVGGGISYFIYVSTSKMYVLSVWLPATSIPALLTLAIAFLKIKDIPFIKFSMLQLERILRPTKTHFAKGAAEVRKSCLSPVPKPKQVKQNDKKLEKKQEYVKENLSNLEEITKVLDSQN